mmetsp:Transcript_8711/g.15550  ORF Transcript_8711/g.15550 Transcript_8711/m.15550 type:complete len:82 (+) Transcript_8711:1136-1381(+)
MEIVHSCFLVVEDGDFLCLLPFARANDTAMDYESRPEFGSPRSRYVSPVKQDISRGSMVLVLGQLDESPTAFLAKRLDSAL